MKLSSAFALLLASLVQVQGQDIVLNAAHNSTAITGTWASGYGKVVTGSGFATPANASFTYPDVTGVSYSFSEDMYYEIARYRFNSNASQPNCITGVMSWCHGQYTLESNGTIVLTPLGDGYQQVQDPCAAESNFVENFNYTELITKWTIDQDVTRGYRLRLWDYAGSPLPPQYLLSTTPNMLPKTSLREVAIDPDSLVTQRKREINIARRGTGEHARRELGFREPDAESWVKTALNKIFGSSSSDRD
ncbi:chaperone for protein-folding within the ER, fungal-domain-containing protein [Schizophyllum amplum]|uniref:Protein ROT1 n=1 Tax=Schizophyllum amplum TaxID=97359 RepID=A0A550CBB8_9AGAR|nr:chaperone for protein-folding within the ER, fungal-domain-containing protein [Auriculariopsis ampla]